MFIKDEAPSYATVKRWVADFKRGHVSLTDDPRPGRPPTSVTPENINRIRELVEENYKIKCREITQRLHC